MRKDLALLGLVCLACVAGAACGGNVVVDGASAASTGGSVSTGGSSPACDNLAGEQLSNGGCTTDATCSGQPISIVCGPAPSGTEAACSCTVNGSVVSNCVESLTSTSLCSPTAGCCASAVGG